jgi:hypothetical protein
LFIGFLCMRNTEAVLGLKVVDSFYSMVTTDDMSGL